MTTLAQISSNQASKEVAANELFRAVSHAGLFGKRIAGTTGLTLGYYGGYMLVDGVLSNIADGTIALTASTTNYVEATRAGVVSKNTTSFTAGQIPLYTAATDGSTITTLTDYRTWASPVPWVGNVLLKTWPSDANYTLSAAEARADEIRLSGATLTTTRDLIVPLYGRWIVYNNTGGAQSVRVIGATGTGVTIATGKTAIVSGDGTNINRITADV